VQVTRDLALGMGALLQDTHVFHGIPTASASLADDNSLYGFAECPHSYQPLPLTEAGRVCIVRAESPLLRLPFALFFSLCTDGSLSFRLPMRFEGACRDAASECSWTTLA
jgi:hypothetical protein